MSSIETETIIIAMQTAPISLKGEFVWGSNHTFLVEVAAGADTFMAVYKPTRGERPLWDFPEASLARREAAAFIVSQALGWELVPPTVYRSDGPFGAGSLQLFIDHDPEYHYFNLSEEDRQRLRPVALFDLLVNNADRKGSHVIFEPDGHLWLIDHGICFHAEPKLRTVIWDFAGEPFPAELAADLFAFQHKLESEAELSTALQPLLDAQEIAALSARAARLLKRGKFPYPPTDHRPIPWPPI
jgi:uncharacterized repeat protein (TIGR03843 family)